MNADLKLMDSKHHRFFRSALIRVNPRQNNPSHRFGVFDFVTLVQHAVRR